MTSLVQDKEVQDKVAQDKVVQNKNVFAESVLTNFTRNLRLSQHQALQFCRENVLEIHQMFEDGYTSAETVEYILSLVDDVEALRDRLPLVFSGWR